MADRRSPRPQSAAHSRKSYEEQVSRSAARGASKRGSSYVPSRSAGADAYTRKRKSRKRKVVLRGVLIGILCVLLAGGGALAMYIGGINNQLTMGLDSSTKELLADSVQYDDPFYMLLLGVDKSQERMDSAEYGEADSNYRSDSIILARIDPKGQTVTLISLHRDLMTDMSDAGAGTQKLNAAYSLGGPSYMIKCVEKLCGVDISHYAEVDFEQFAGIVDTIGGITVNLPIDIKDNYSGADFSAGEHTLNGQEALALARSRHAYDDYGDGDTYRAANQRMIIAAIVKKVLSLDLATMTNAVSQLAGGVTTDINISDILGLAVQFKDLDVANNVYSGMTPTGGYYINNTWYEKLDETAWQQIMDRVKEGKPPLSDSSDDKTSGLIGTMAGADALTTAGEGSGTGTSDSTSSSSDSAGVAPVFSGTVDVVNSSGISGAAANTSQKLGAAGFTCSEAVFDSDETTTKVYYNGSDAKAKAVGVAQTLGISESNVIANTGAWTTNYEVVLVLCSDKAK
ncbi:LCP family protein [Paratractidigestivibacter sp.]|uniref:LCP family protein n=1 Tax=Paratractidigestivibacter sp. TaxID=2847316 RepID=UPI003AB290E8